MKLICKYKIPLFRQMDLNMSVIMKTTKSTAKENTRTQMETFTTEIGRVELGMEKENIPIRRTKECKL